MRVLLVVLVALAALAVGCAGHPTPPASTPPKPATARFDADAVDITTDWEGSPPETLRAKAAAVSLTASDGSGLRLAALEARAVLYGPLAFTELHLTFENDENRVREGTFSIALPESAAISRFAMRLREGWQEGEVVEQKLAREAYERFLHHNVDPALFERDRGNVFRGRVFPILPKEQKEIVISWTEELKSAEQPYRLALRGLPAIDQLDVQLLVPSRKKAFVLHRQQWAPERDFVYLPPPGSPSAVRGGRFAVARPAPSRGADVAAPVDSLAVVVDASASQAASYVHAVELTRRVVDGLGAKSVQIACFDQEVEPMPSLAEVAKRTPGGASDLRAALRWIKTTKAKRALLVTDGIASSGPFAFPELAHEVLALRAAGVERVDAVMVGGQRNESLLQAIAGAGLAQEGVVVDGDGLTPDAIAGQLRNVARPRVGLTYLEMDPDAPALRDLVAEEAPVPLVARAVAKSRIDTLSRERSAPVSTDARREELRAEIVALSIQHRVLSDFTSMLVLETEADYARFRISRSAMREILAVGARGVEVVPRGGGSMVLPKTTGVSPIVEPPRPGGTPAKTGTGQDSDADGIPDALDKCPTEPETYNGFEDEDGCPDRARVIIRADEIIIIQTVRFRDGSAEISPISLPLIEAVVAVMKGHPELDLVALVGHTDNRGSADANVALSLSRANAVRDALIKRGVSARRLVARGVGGRLPIDDNATSEGRDANRRVELKILIRNGQPTGVSDGEGRSFTPPNPRARHGKAEPAGAPLSGSMHEVDMLLAQGKTDDAIERAQAWRSMAPSDLLACAAEGKALHARGRHREAARAYGSMLDLASKPEHRRAAASFLESLALVYPPALEIAVDAYRRALADRPEVPSSHRLLAYALARADRAAEGFEVILAALVRPFDSRRYPGAFEMLREDAGLLAAALARGKGRSEHDMLESRAKAVGGTFPTTPSTRVTVSWETDESDLDLRLVDPKANVKFPEVDVRTGYGPESVLLDRARSAPLRLEVHQVTRGPSGFTLGKVAIVRHDGLGGLTFEDRPFVLMNDGAAVQLGVVK
jgi:outer membrane protein OmpA-like peptidoglycan-associated protein